MIDIESGAADDAGILHALHAFGDGRRRHADAARQLAHREARFVEKQPQDVEIGRIEQAAYVIE